MVASNFKSIMMDSSLDGLVAAEFDRLFNIDFEPHGTALHHMLRVEKHRRLGIHASALIQEKGFCYRQFVLENNYKRTDVPFPQRVKRIFRNGTFVHLKWQALFMAAGIADHVETGHISSSLDIGLSPDAVIRLFGRRFVVEIKSVNTIAFRHTRTAPKAAVGQCMLYMHFLGIPQGIILCEDKNNQEFKVWVIDYSPELVRLYVKRAHGVARFMQLFKKEHRLPKRICVRPTEARAKGCPSRVACFASRDEREKVLL